MNLIEKWLKLHGLNDVNIDNLGIQKCTVSYAIYKFCEEHGLELNIHDLSDEVNNETEVKNDINDRD